MSVGFSSIADAISALRRGEIIIVLDAEDRENEGDFICAADTVTPAVVNFMITHGKGMLCMPVLPDVAQRLELSPLLDNRAQHLPQVSTAFAMPIDHRSAKTGITAPERAATVRAVIDPESRPEDFIRPGHLNMLIAKEGGVLRRAGHTEATVDLARMAGLFPAGILCEILDAEGNRGTRDFLMQLAAQHGLQIVTIEDLIRHRRRSETLVERLAEARLPTKYGEWQVIAYSVKYEQERPIVLVMGDLSQATAPLVRVHSSCFTGDLLESLRCDCGDQLHLAMEMISREGCGVLVYLQQEGRGIGLIDKLKAYQLQDQGLDTVEANEALGYKADIRDYGIGIQLLKDLGLREVRLLTNNPKKRDAFVLGGFDLRVVGEVRIAPPTNEHNARYIATKRDKLGHLLPEE